MFSHAIWPKYKISPTKISLKKNGFPFPKATVWGKSVAFLVGLGLMVSKLTILTWGSLRGLVRGPVGQGCEPCEDLKKHHVLSSHKACFFFSILSSLHGPQSPGRFEESLVPPISLDGLQMAVELGTDPPLLDVPPGTWQVTSSNTQPAKSSHLLAHPWVSRGRHLLAEGFGGVLTS